jgi:hypothetical protein
MNWTTIFKGRKTPQTAFINRIMNDMCMGEWSDDSHRYFNQITDINLAGTNGSTLLATAVHLGNASMLETLLQRDADPRHPTAQGLTPLQLVINSAGLWDFVANRPRDDCAAPLLHMGGVLAEYPACMKLLLEYGALEETQNIVPFTLLQSIKHINHQPTADIMAAQLKDADSLRQAFINSGNAPQQAPRGEAHIR